MPKYAALILTERGARRRHTLEARTLEEARAKLRATGVFIERISQTDRSWQLRRLKIARKHQIHLFRQMQTLLSAGILIPDAVGKLKDRFPDRRTRQVLQEVHARIVDSRGNLSQALGGFSRSFPVGVVSMIAAGEEAGTAVLAERFGDLAERLAYEYVNRREVAKACAYPALVIAMACGLYVFLLAVVFPRLAELLASIGGSLPPLTRAVIAASQIVRREWPLLLAAGAALPIALWALRKTPAIAVVIDRAFLRLPLVGAIYRNLTVALFCTIYRSLYKANKPAPEIIDACAKLVGNRAFSTGLENVRRRVATGRSTLSQALEDSGLFPPIACVLIDVGEESGKLAEALDRVAKHFAEEAKERIAALIAVINPVMTLLVVGGVGVIMLSFFQAVYQVVYATH